MLEAPLATAARHLATAEPGQITVSAQATARRRKTAPVGLIMGVRLVFPSSGTVVVYT